MRPFTERLLAAKERGGMIPADLAVWFDRPYQTVLLWLTRGSLPREPGRTDALRRLALLEKTIAARGLGLPVPALISTHARPGYVRGIREAILADPGLLTGHSARRRA